MTVVRNALVTFLIGAVSISAGLQLWRLLAPQEVSERELVCDCLAGQMQRLQVRHMRDGETSHVFRLCRRWCRALARNADVAHAPRIESEGLRMPAAPGGFRFVLPHCEGDLCWVTPDIGSRIA